MGTRTHCAAPDDPRYRTRFARQRPDVVRVRLAGRASPLGRYSIVLAGGLECDDRWTSKPAIDMPEAIRHISFTYMNKSRSKGTEKAVKSADRVLDLFELLSGWGQEMSHVDIATALEFRRAALPICLEIWLLGATSTFLQSAKAIDWVKPSRN